jgi:hypothetical protein
LLADRAKLPKLPVEQRIDALPLRVAQIEVKPQPQTLPQPERAEVAPPLSPASSSPLTNSTRSGFVREELTVRPESDDPVAIARTPGAPATATSTLSRDELMVSEARRNGALLPGAFLQILGTRYSTIADDHGRYRLTFDPSLVGPCRTQVVRVTATGYRAQNLILAVGSADNTILMSRR